MRLIALVFLFATSACVQEVEVCTTDDAGPNPVDLCGNNVIDQGEECDDGNPRNGDGCTNQCKVEPRPECGNGLIEGSENCDDGNNVDFDACGNDCQFTADNNDNWEDAEQTGLGNNIAGAIFPAGDSDFYRFEGEAGQWIFFTTEANEDDDDALIDTVITLYDSNRTRVAQNDDYDSDKADSRLVMRLPSTDTYYLKVEDAQNMNGGLQRGERNFTYTLKLQIMNLDSESVNLETENGNDAENAQVLTWSERYHYNWIVGDFADENDVDVFSFNIPTSEEAGDRTQFDMNIFKASASGNGATHKVGRVWVADSDGVIVARKTMPNDFETFSPNLAPGDYTFWVEHPGDSAGSNDFYTLLVYRRSDNDPETEEETNGSLASAESLSLSPNGSLKSAFFLAQLPEGDVDYFRVDLAASQRLSVVCRSRTSGSGVIDLSVAVHDADDNELSSDSEGSDKAYISDANAGLSEAGPLYIRLSKIGQVEDVRGHFVRCGVHSRNR
ncbi:MAG: DUF4215 domain-containing protein [Myxococcota bacterium]|nr:DUF4215 domain-containing protein [Myxococcota bacterium]